MTKSDYQKFRDFKAKHKLSEKKMAEIVTAYANSSDEFARGYFCNRYEITPSVFYKIRDFCIIFMLVDPYICRKIRTKAERNQSSGKGNGSGKTKGLSTQFHYEALLERRRQYLYSFLPNEVRSVANLYAKGFAISEICERHNISRGIVKRLIVRALMEDLVDFETFETIKVRSTETFSLESFQAFSRKFLGK